MMCRCPNCKAVSSLDVFISDIEAVEVLKIILELGNIGRLAIRYIGLFRPDKSQLSWGRTAKLLKELLPMIQTASIQRGGIEYPAPIEAWEHGFNETLAARDLGRLKTPLKTHGYLYEIVIGWSSSHSATPAQASQAAAKASQTLTAAAQLENLKR